MHRLILSGIALLTVSAAPAMAQARKAAPTPAAADQAWVTEAAGGGMAEVELGKLAQQKASAPDVKTFAQRMVDDHSKANDELKMIADRNHLTIPSAIDRKHQALHDRLSKLSGEAFDKAYMQAMIQDHTEDVAAFRKESQSGKDPEVKAFAAKHLPTIEDHLKMARSTDKQIVSTSGTKTTPKAKRPAPPAP
jgi:putative membrane protein